jgi:hypothetical protein
MTNPTFGGAFAYLKRRSGDLSQHTSCESLAKAAFGTVWSRATGKSGASSRGVKINQIVIRRDDRSVRAGRQALAIMDHPNIAIIWMLVQPRLGVLSLRWNWCEAPRSQNTATNEAITSSDKAVSLQFAWPFIMRNRMAFPSGSEAVE